MPFTARTRCRRAGADTPHKSTGARQKIRHVMPLMHMPWSTSASRQHLLRTPLKGLLFSLFQCKIAFIRLFCWIRAATKSAYAAKSGHISRHDGLRHGGDMPAFCAHVACLIFCIRRLSRRRAAATANISPLSRFINAARAVNAAILRR